MDKKTFQSDSTNERVSHPSQLMRLLALQQYFNERMVEAVYACDEAALEHYELIRRIINQEMHRIVRRAK